VAVVPGRLVGNRARDGAGSLKSGLRLALLARSENLLSEVADEREVRRRATPVYFICDVSDESASITRSQRRWIVLRPLTSDQLAPD